MEPQFHTVKPYKWQGRLSLFGGKFIERLRFLNVMGRRRYLVNALMGIFIGTAFLIRQPAYEEFKLLSFLLPGLCLAYGIVELLLVYNDVQHHLLFGVLLIAVSGLALLLWPRGSEFTQPTTLCLLGMMLGVVHLNRSWFALRRRRELHRMLERRVRDV